MKVHTTDGLEVEISVDEAKRIHGVMAGHGNAEKYAAKTAAVLTAAQEELREVTGDFPENLKELYEFAVKHELFGDREATHIVCNFLKVFYGLMQEKTHYIA